MIGDVADQARAGRPRATRSPLGRSPLGPLAPLLLPRPRRDRAGRRGAPGRGVGDGVRRRRRALAGGRSLVTPCGSPALAGRARLGRSAPRWPASPPTPRPRGVEQHRAAAFDDAPLLEANAYVAMARLALFEIGHDRRRDEHRRVGAGDEPDQQAPARTLAACSHRAPPTRRPYIVNTGSTATSVVPTERVTTWFNERFMMSVYV